MYPLLNKDNAIIPYYCTYLIFLILVINMVPNDFWTVLSNQNEYLKNKTSLVKNLNRFFKYLVGFIKRFSIKFYSYGKF